MIARTHLKPPSPPTHASKGCIAVTGGGGFLGLATVTELLAQGYAVRGLARSDGAAHRLAQAGAQVVRGSLDDRAALATLCRRASAVIHAAARVDVSASKREYQRDTVDGTVRLLRAAFDGGARRVIYASSAAVYGAASGDVLSTERSATRPPRYHHYALAKLAAEHEISARCALTGMTWAIFRMPFLVGPGDSPLVRQLAPVLRANRVFVIRPGTNRLAWVDVRDAARALRLALAGDCPPDTIFDLAADEAVTQRRFFDAHADALGIRRPRRVVRRWIARVAARIAECYGRLSNRRVTFNRATVDLFSADQAIDSTRARRTLGWQPRYSFGDSMSALAQWLHEEASPRQNALASAPCETG